jgi:hypothetical protein
MFKNKYFFISILLISILAGGWFLKTQLGNTKPKVSTKKLLPEITDTTKNTPFEPLNADSLLKKSTPIMGYRFIITGDFDGDKQIDTLIERYTDSLFNKEAPKFYENPDTSFDYDEIIFISEYLNNKSFISWKNIKLKGGQLGFHFIENCGDLNLDGKDELLVVEQWPDWSNLNQAYIYTFNQNQWQKIYSIPVWEWQFPPTPSATMVPSLFGNFQIGTTRNESSDNQLEKSLKEFKFMKYYNDQTIEFSGRNPFSMSEDEENEFEEIGDQAYIKKYFKKTYIKDSLYLNEKANSAMFYKANESKTAEIGNVIIFEINDFATMFTTRINLKHPLSPFRKLPKSD